MRRNVKGFPLIIFMFYLTFITIPKNTFSFLVKREAAHLKAFWKGLLWNAAHLNLKNI
jgi:hypothetical protein